MSDELPVLPYSSTQSLLLGSKDRVVLPRSSLASRLITYAIALLAAGVMAYSAVRSIERPRPRDSLIWPDVVGGGAKIVFAALVALAAVVQLRRLVVRGDHPAVFTATDDSLVLYDPTNLGAQPLSWPKSEIREIQMVYRGRSLTFARINDLHIEGHSAELARYRFTTRDPNAASMVAEKLRHLCKPSTDVQH